MPIACVFGMVYHGTASDDGSHANAKWGLLSVSVVGVVCVVATRFHSDWQLGSKMPSSTNLHSG